MWWLTTLEVLKVTGNILLVAHALCTMPRVSPIVEYYSNNTIVTASQPVGAVSFFASVCCSLPASLPIIEFCSVCAHVGAGPDGKKFNITAQVV